MRALAVLVLVAVAGSAQAGACRPETGVRYVARAAVRLNAYPDGASPVMNLAAGTALEVDCAQGPWLHVSAPRYAGVSGWLARAATDEAQPTSASVHRALAAATPGSADHARLAALAVALDPLDRTALDASLSAQLLAGDMNAAQRTRDRLAQLDAPRVGLPEAGLPALMLAEGSHLLPLASLGRDGPLPFGGNLSLLFAAGAAYRALDDGSVLLVTGADPGLCGNPRAQAVWQGTAQPAAARLVSNAEAAPAFWRRAPAKVAERRAVAKLLARGAVLDSVWQLTGPHGNWVYAVWHQNGHQGWLLAAPGRGGQWQLRQRSTSVGAPQLLGAFGTRQTWLALADAAGWSLWGERGGQWQQLRVERQCRGARGVVAGLSATNRP